MSLHIIFESPVIPPNTGNAIRMCACTGAVLHLVEPLGFSLEEKHLRRAGLDYHDLADVTVHPDLDSAFAAVPGNIYAFTSNTDQSFADVSYADGDGLLCGCEPSGLTDEALAHDGVCQQVRIPMLPARRSMNLSNAAAIACFEAWRQLGYTGAV